MLSSPTTFVVLLTVLAGFVVLGVRAGRSCGEVSGYVLARGTQSAGMLGLSFLASGLGAWILFAPAELGVLLGSTAVVGYALAAAAPFAILAAVGPRIRRLIPSGHGLTEFLRVRFGPAAGTAVALVSLLYMGVFVAAELVAIGGLVELLGGVRPQVTVTAVGAATLLYTTYGGLKASLVTDRWQSWLVVGLLGIAAAVAVTSVDAPVEAVRGSGLVTVDRPGIETAITLILAVTAANLFHHGYWQRVWAARDDDALRRGAVIGAVATIPVMLVAGGLGVLAASVGVVEVPALSLFSLVTELPTVVVGAVLVLGIALVASSVDTLENGLAALIVAERPRLRLSTARWATVVIVAPAAIVALFATSVLQLFLIADLLCAVIVGPALLGLWRRATTAGVTWGALAGVLGAVVASWASTGSWAGAGRAVLFTDAAPTLPPFAGAVVASTLVAVLLSASRGHQADLTELEPAVRSRVATGEVADG